MSAKCIRFNYWRKVFLDKIRLELKHFHHNLITSVYIILSRSECSFWQISDDTSAHVVFFLSYLFLLFSGVVVVLVSILLLLNAVIFCELISSCEIVVDFWWRFDWVLFGFILCFFFYYLLFFFLFHPIRCHLVHIPAHPHTQSVSFSISLSLCSHLFAGRLGYATNAHCARFWWEKKRRRKCHYGT